MDRRPDRISYFRTSPNCDFPRLENGNVAHGLGNLDRLRSDELALELGGAILEQHGDDLFEVLAELIERRALGVCTRPPRDVADEESRGLVALDDCREALHAEMIPCEGPPNKPMKRSLRGLRMNAEAASQLIKDIARYESHQDCKHLICLAAPGVRPSQRPTKGASRGARS